MRPVTEIVKRVVSVGCCVVVSGVASGAAPMPGAMRMVPEGTDLMVVTPDLGELLRDMDALNAAFGEQSSMDITLATSLVRGMPGIDRGGSAAIALEFGGGGFETEPEMIAIVPVSDFDALRQGREAVDGVVELNMGGTAVFLRSIGGGYAALGRDAGSLRSFEPGSRADGALTEMLGATGVRVAEQNDAFMVLDMDAVRPMLEAGFGQLEAQADMAELMAGPEAARGLDAMISVYKSAVRDGRVVLHGMNFERQTGLSMDFAVGFTDGSETALKLNNPGNADAHMRRVPATGFFTAWAYDFSGEGFREMLTEAGAFIEGMDAAGVGGGIDFGGMLKAYNGGAFVMGSTDAMMMNGLFSKTVYYGATDEPGESIGMFREMYKGMDGSEQQGVSVTASVSDDPETVDGVSAYTHTMRMEMDPAMAGGGPMGGPSPTMMMQMMYGPNLGPSGYLAPVDGGVVMTMSRDAAMLKRSVNAARGIGTLKEDPGIAAASALLPENRVLEGYIGTEHVLNAVGPMLMMFGVVPEFEPVGAMTPVAMGATADGGAVMLRAVVPVKTITTVMEMVPENMGMPGAGGGAAPGPADDGDDEDISF